MPNGKIAIIAGAGPAGLTAAYELIKRTDITPIVLEATDAIGGIAQTYNYKGNRIDIGGHRFFSKSERVMDWWFNIMPPQGKPSADTEEKDHQIDYAAEVVVEYLCKECIEECRVQSAECRDTEKSRSSNLAYRQAGLESRTVRKAPDPEKEDNVMLQRPRISRIFYNRNFFPYPIGITLKIAGRLGWINTFLIGMSYIKSRIFPEKDETYLDGFFKNRFGRRLYATFFRDYTEKVWGVPCSKIKADWGAQRIKGLSLKRAVVHAVKDLFSSDFSKAQKNRETSLITRFYYPKFGPGQMWETVTDQINACGGEVRMGKRVVGVKWKNEDNEINENNEAMEGEKSEIRNLAYRQAGPKSENFRITSVTVEDVFTGDCEEVECDYFFSTMPVRHLISQMHPQPPDRALEVAEGLIYRDFLTVGLLLKKLHVKVKGEKPADSVPDNWIYIQEGDVRVGRVQIFNNWSPYMVVDNKDTTWIGLEYFVDEGDDLWIKKDEDMINFGIDEMERINFLKKEDVLDSCVLRMPKAYPAYFGSYDNLHVVKDFVTQFNNMFLIGRNGMHRYNNQDHSMLTAMTAVDNICEGRTDSSNIWEVNVEKEYHEEKS